MGEMKKITVEVDAGALAEAQKFVNGGIAETIREAVAYLAARQAQKELLNFKGNTRFEFSIEELRAMDDDK